MLPFSVKCDYVRGVCVVTGGTFKCKMPSDIVSMVSTGLGVSVLAGILSGVCYVLAHGIIRNGRTRKKRNEWYCEICDTYVNSSILNDELVACSKCGANVCKGKCSKFVQKTKWFCQNCLQPSESWFKGILKTIQYSSNGISGIFGPTMNPQDFSDPDLESLRKLEKEQVRDFIEKLVNVMLGENVDSASVSMLYNDKQYLPITGQSPCTAHAALKQLIEKLLKQAVNLPILEQAHAHSETPSEVSTNRSYEDLLATAIINKVVSSCQNNLPSSSTNSVCSRVSTSSQHKEDKEYFFGEETLDSKWKTTDLDTTSISSLEDWMQSESSFGSRKYVDKVTLMIKQDIEEVEDFDSENEVEDDAEYFRSSSSLFNDSESNWFLQKRHFQGTHSPVPVPMLVPNPTSDAKVLIGDKPLDDTSDLSEVESEYGETELPQSTQSLLVQSKHVIGVGTSSFEVIENGDEHSESSTDSGVKEVNGKEQKSFDLPESTRTDITVDDDNIEDSSFLSVYSNTEKEAEYTEKYASLPRQIIKPLSPKLDYNETSDSNIIQNNYKESNKSQNNNGDFEYVGNYSKKEKEKWKHAVEMKNNPYSKENIEKRIKRSSSGTSSPIFGPDYYARLAKNPSGGGERLTPNEIVGESWSPLEFEKSKSPSPPPELPKVGPPPVELIQTIFDRPLETPYLTPELTNSVEKTSNNLPELPKMGPPSKVSFEMNDVHLAVQAVVTPVEEKTPFNSFEPQIIDSFERKTQGYKRGNYIVETNTSELTSDSDLSYVNFYDVEHSQVFRKSKNENVQIPIKATPLGVSYKSIPDENGNRPNEVDSNRIILHNNKQEKTFKDTPVAKPRVLSGHSKPETGVYIKSGFAVNQKVKSATNKPILRRNFSESDLLEQPMEITSKVSHHKKDNTLISKIYKDPKVRLFALHSREEHPVNDVEYTKPVLNTQFSLDSKAALSEHSSLYISKTKSYNSSDDGVTSEYESGKTGKMSFFSSEEDLLSINSEEGFRNNNLTFTKHNGVQAKTVIGKNRKTHLPQSPNYVLTPRSNNNKFIYGSQEDLLSIDEIGALPQRKDNTLISKIYKDSKVRNFAIKAHGEIITDYEPPTTPKTPISHKAFSSDEEHYHTDSTVTVQKRNLSHKKVYSSYDDLSSTDISLENRFSHTNNYSSQHDLHQRANENTETGYKSDDIDVGEVAKRHIVRNALGKYSKSTLNVKSHFIRSTSIEDGDEVRVSVRDLKKKFETKDSGTKPVVSSLTARSLSKQVKDSLKQ